MTQREEIMGLEIEKYIGVLIAENFNEDSEKVKAQKYQTETAIFQCVAENYYSENLTKMTARLLIYQAGQVARGRAQSRKDGK